MHGVIANKSCFAGRIENVFNTSKAYPAYFDSYSRFDEVKEYHEGIIALSACLAGEIPDALRKGLYQTALNAAQEMSEIFGVTYVLTLSVKQRFKIIFLSYAGIS